MNMTRMSRVVAFALGIMFVGAAGSALAQQAPTETKGVKADLLHTLGLGPQIEVMEGYQLRVWRFTVEPGGVVGNHSHVDRPGTAYVLQGTYHEFREGVGWTAYGAGESLIEGKEVTHWGENRGAEPVIILGVDIVKQP